jgi:hypothetical protein
MVPIIIPVSQGHNAGLPTPAASATRELADRVQELVHRVHLPVRRFPAAGHNDTRLVERGGDVHRASDRAQDARRVVHQPNQLSNRRLANEIHHTPKRRMVIARQPAQT